ncbi:hypothetical protein AVEN_97297-1 [Araneus ventricosus]|uniref:Uncharacterized protein n=1 Tax=Araneus ventricosus TaxID=182803 RepID=A0A4Y2T6Q3_ARAVE|nr:hypothetical protein AVEN_97297-1 [Araneus ventricosus]
METTSLIHRPCLSTRDYSIWWSLCDGMGRVQLACYGTPDTSRDDSDRYLSILPDHLHSFMSIVHPDGLGQFQQDNATPTRRELLPNGSRHTLLTLDTSIGHLNPQR